MVKGLSRKEIQGVRDYVNNGMGENLIKVSYSIKYGGKFGRQIDTEMSLNQLNTMIESKNETFVIFKYWVK